MWRSRCSTCNASLVWAVMPKGKKMPCEAKLLGLSDLAPDRRYVARFSPGVFRLSTGEELLTQLDAFSAEVEVYEPHWGNCNNADHHRRR